MSVPAKKERYESAMRCGVRIAEVRKSRGLTLKQVAMKTGFSPQQIFLVEKGEINTPIETLARIANALTVPLAALVADDAQASIPTPETSDPGYQLFLEYSQRFLALGAQTSKNAIKGNQDCSTSKQVRLYQKQLSSFLIPCYA